MTESMEPSGSQRTGADVVTKQADRLYLRVADWTLRQVRANVLRWREANAAKRVLCIDRDPEVAYRSASVHSLFRDTVHPDNLDPLLAFTGADISRGDDRGDSEVDLEIVQKPTVPLGWSQVRFGSPTSDGGTRMLFGYGGEGENNRLIREVEPLEIPFRWELERVGDHVAYRNVRGQGKVGRPLWRIVGGKHNTPYVPDIGPDGFLKTDYLLVTRVRNYLGDDWRAGKFIVSFGGAHGIGTRAVELLVKDQRELAKAYNALRALAKWEGEGDVPNCFQLLLKVGEIDHDDPEAGSHATKILFEQAALIEDTDDLWTEAARRVQPALDKWQTARTNESQDGGFGG